MAFVRMLLCFLVLSAGFHAITSETNPSDVAALQSFKEKLQNTPPSWSNGDDPCGAKWDGVTCSSTRVTSLKLSSKGLVGELSADIGELTELTSLDLSFNQGLCGSLTPHIGDLQKLETLILQGCSFTGTLPPELGNLGQLSFLSLRGNNFTGEIPFSLGNITKLQWLDLADNQLTGSIPVSTSTSPGLDHLKNAKQLIFSKNQLSGPIPPELFSSDMVLTQVMFDKNQFSGEIPSSIGLVQTILTLFLGENSLTGRIPSNINNLTNLIALDMPNNKLSGPLPNLSGMNSLLRVELSNNSFEESEAPAWFSTLPSLNILNIDNGSLRGSLPPTLFGLPDLAVVSLRNNAFNGTLFIGSNINQNILGVDLENNGISSISIDPVFKSTLK
ncbi:probable leucine-rich repeat receptor-like protein kinase At5g49770 [Coffea eugenioides]|uniref:probable leucine-rich repeat receptor-like protein kinase At5g49770 n=1 Tax=Coffea eugenioides TaxID=49369 RepID=UPI000F60C29A|nr:probable leucine-rich repeat receptor-like protein kinase At5g49770 [Coffea eugenioides]